MITRSIYKTLRNKLTTQQSKKIKWTLYQCMAWKRSLHLKPFKIIKYIIKSKSKSLSIQIVTTTSLPRKWQWKNIFLLSCALDVKFHVIVANGLSFTCEGICHNIKLSIEDYNFSTIMYTILIGRVDVDLAMQLLIN